MRREPGFARVRASLGLPDCPAAERTWLFRIIVSTQHARGILTRTTPEGEVSPHADDDELWDLLRYQEDAQLGLARAIFAAFEDDSEIASRAVDLAAPPDALRGSPAYAASARNTTFLRVANMMTIDPWIRATPDPWGETTERRGRLRIPFELGGSPALDRIALGGIPRSVEPSVRSYLSDEIVSWGECPNGGGECFYFARPERVAFEVAKWEEKARALRGIPEEVAFIRGVANASRDCIAIHPFPDGNGRSCRVWAFYALSRRNIPFPLIWRIKGDFFDDGAAWERRFVDGVKLHRQFIDDLKSNCCAEES
jgi:hypothetical protein